MLETSARLLKLLSLLQSPREWSGAVLADELGVGVRTVRRDIDKLRSLGYPVEAVPGVAGYRLGAGAALPPLLLDDEEAVAVAIGLRAAATGNVTGIEESSLRALTKLEQVLPSRLRHRVDLLRVVAVTPATGATVDPAVLMTVATVCRNHERLRFDYLGHDGTASVRTTEPHRLLHTGRRWYLIAWDLDREDWRTFRLDRLTPRIPTGPRFQPREAPDLDRTREGIASGGYRYQATFHIQAPAEVVADQLAGTVATVEPIDDRTCQLRAGSNSLDELLLYPALLGHPFHLQAAPPELETHLKTLTTRLHQALPTT
ncbi:putative DNA-binding transcriptional regulator YafY [Kribbella amoyensis]|uniref:Putative DNA-binding transcriptional regulator YafY n=1 Tax=Kribbella amoyensis TaxID=996641 RepID=A0A561BKP6_9ACTN|nr:YafY family protein [Kribbella amoyensis]TWD79450.1 putative DNA-binding transcriptional regulator YafY [Kribbella amoyensis]